MSETEASHTSAPAETELPEDGRALSFWQKMAYSAGNFATGFAPGVVMGWLMYYYIEGGEVRLDNGDIIVRPVLVSAFAFGLIQLVGRVTDALVDPLVGYYSDRTNTRWGRRLPWIFVGTPGLALVFFALWFPPQHYAGWLNNAYLAVMLSLFWIFFTVLVAPYLSLLPEITPFRKERIVTSTIMGVFELLGLAFAFLATGILFDIFGVWGEHGPGMGVWLVASIGASLTLVFGWMPLINIREKGDASQKIAKFRLVESVTTTLRNFSFKIYVIAVGFFRIGIDLISSIIPIFVIHILLHSEGFAAVVQAVMLVTGLLLFPFVQSLADRKGKKKVFNWGVLFFAMLLPLLCFTYHFPFLGMPVAALMNALFPNSADALQAIGAAQIMAACGGLDSQTYSILFPSLVEAQHIIDVRTFHTLVIFALASFPIAVLYILPRAVLADVIDDDANKTGYRREAVFNGVEGLITKAAAGLGPAIAASILFTFFGKTTAEPGGLLLAGPVAGFFCLIAWWTFRRYPFKD